MNEIAVSARNVTRIYGSGDSVVRAISDVSLEVARGEWIGVKGRSGSGKTTLLNCLSGLDRPTSGEIVCFGRDIARLSESQMTEWRRNQVSFIFQSFALMPTLSAFENVDLPMRIAGMPKRRERVVVLGAVALVLVDESQDWCYAMQGDTNVYAACVRGMHSMQCAVFAIHGQVAGSLG